MGEPNTADAQQMRRDLIASATADPTEFVDRVMENFNKLTSRISQADERIAELTATAENQAALITELSMKKDQAKREAEQLLSKARQDAAEIISEAKAQAKQLTNQAETKLINANVEADSIKTTKLNAIRGDISTLESQRLTERDRTLGFLHKVSSEYDGIIEQYAQTLAQLRKAKTFVADQASEIESVNFEHFDIDQYLPHHTYQLPMSQGTSFGTTEPIVEVPAMPVTQPAAQIDPVAQLAQQPVMPPAQQAVPQPQPVVSQPLVQPQPAVAQQVPQPVAQASSEYVDDNGIMPSRSFNEAFQMGGQSIADDYDDDYSQDDYGQDDYNQGIDEFGDSGLLMEAMAGMADEPEDDFEELAPSDSGLLMDALSNIDDVDEQRDIEDFSEMDDFDEFEETAPPAPPVRQRVKVPHRRRSRRNGNQGW